MDITLLHTNEPDFEQRLQEKLAWEAVVDEKVERVVKDILQDVRTRGNAAVLEYTNRFDRRELKNIQEAEVSPERLQQALNTIPKAQREALEQAAARITAFHQHQKEDSWQYTEEDGTVLGQQITPMDRVAMYVPGGLASYPSSVLMTILPAKVAGVSEVIMTVPAPDNQLNDIVLAAAAVAGVDRIITLGGAQAIAALAYGTETIPKVDKIVGPGNMYVATAKSMVFGTVGIDMIAGPSEILVVCDGQTQADWIAMDLFSQAEHDTQAQSILLCPNRDFIDLVHARMAALIEAMPRADIIRESIAKRGMLIQVSDLDEAIALVNRIAPEHVELSVANAESYLPQIRHAGAIFLGRYTPEAVGDYCAGPNHVLPTSGSARFSSPLGVYDFQKRSSIIACTAEGGHTLGQLAGTLADTEGLTAHANSARYRVNP
ncbi:MAG: histidinol dehydrogenase [Pseudomonadota bacterium]